MPSSSSTIPKRLGERRKAHSHPARSAAATSLSASDLGTKVSILFRIDDPEHPFSEAVGLVQRIGDGVYLIRKRDGSTVEVPADKVVTLKRVRPA